LSLGKAHQGCYTVVAGATTIQFTSFWRAMENLDEYEQQLDDVGRLLLQEPNNEELLAIYNDLTEVRGDGTPTSRACCRQWPCVLRDMAPNTPAGHPTDA
jgi:hypothetical protein